MKIPEPVYKDSYGHDHKPVTLPSWGVGRQRQEDYLVRLFTSIAPDKLKKSFLKRIRQIMIEQDS